MADVERVVLVRVRDQVPEVVSELRVAAVACKLGTAMRAELGDVVLGQCDVLIDLVAAARAALRVEDGD